jgi:hypothetical protein
MSIWAISSTFGLTQDFSPETRLARATLAAPEHVLPAQQIGVPMA